MADICAAGRRATAEQLIVGAAEPEVRASALLRAHLSRDQRVTFIARGYFDVVSQLGRRYRITRGWGQNVFLLGANDTNEWVPVQRYCAVSYDIPMADLLLVQKLLLETNEALFLRTAYRDRVPPTPSSVY